MVNPADVPSGSASPSAASLLPDLEAAGRLWSAFDAEPSATPPARVAGFRMLAPLGAGGQGSTWLAEREVDGTMVAVKFAAFAAGVPLERLWSELEALSRCRLPCVARLAGHGIADGHPWIATEYVDGDRLDAWCIGRSLRDSIEMMARVADAVSSLHGAGLVHRDIKPANVIVAAGDRPILIDLGLGASLDSPLDRTIDGLPAGSPAFMSPEQARGERSAIGPATDIFSLGATAFLLLAGEPPHAAAGSVAAQVARAGTEPPRRASKVNRLLPPAVAAVLDWAVQPRIEDRPPDAATLAQAFRAASAGRSIVPGLGGPRRRWVVGILLVALGFATLLVALAAPGLLGLQQGSGSDGTIEAASGVVPLTTEHAVMIPGDYGDSRFGASIAIVGNLEGGGLDAVVIGAPGAPGRQPNGSMVELAGEVSIVRGSDLRATLDDPATRVLSPVHRIAGSDVRGHAGAVVASAGDMDGDSTDEIAVIAEGPERDIGFVTIISGRQVLNVSTFAGALAAGHAIRIDGVELGKMGSAMTACDVDGDGLDDLLVGCPGAGAERNGQVMVVHGSRRLFGHDAQVPTVHRVDGPEGTFGFGRSLATTHGCDGPYVAIGAPLGERPEPGGTGRVIIANAHAFAEGRLTAPAFVAARGRPDEWFGQSVALMSLPLEGKPHRTLYAVGGGSGIANASNDGGMAVCVELGSDDACAWHAESDLFASRGMEAPLGRGQQMGAAVACHVAWMTPMIAVGSPADGIGDLGCGSVTVWEPMPEQWKLPQWESTRTTYHGSKRGFGAGLSLAWWSEYDARGQGEHALLIGAPGEDSPLRHRAAGAVWVVWR